MISTTRKKRSIKIRNVTAERGKRVRMKTGREDMHIRRQRNIKRKRRSIEGTALIVKMRSSTLNHLRNGRKLRNSHF